MLGIVFEGCACRAAFHAGVAAALNEAGMRFPLAAGASSGSICAAAVAAGRAAELPTRFRSLAGRSIVSLRRVLYNRSVFDMSHLVRGALREAFGAMDLRAGPAEAVITATHARDFSPRVFSSRHEPDFVEPVLGSCFLPVLYGRPVRYRGEWLIDGGFTDNLPLEALVARGATELLAVVTSHEGLALKSPRRMQWRPAAHGARVHVIHPRRPLEVRSWDLDRDRMHRAIDEGFARGREFAGR